MTFRGTNDPASCRSDFLSWGAAALLLTGAVLMLPHGHLHNFGTVPWFLAGAAVMLSGFFMALRFPPRALWVFWTVAVGARLMLLFQAPGDDIFRYVWEGRILLAGWNPYLHAPDAVVLEPLRDGLWASVQHKAFTAIYPPLAQWMMAALTAIWTTPIFFKALFALADIAVIALLVHRFGAVRTLLYAWNPLVIYAFAGGGHYDSVFALALVLGWFAWENGRHTRAAAWLGVAVAIKWMALPMLAWVGWRIFLKACKTSHWRPVFAGALAGALPLAGSYAALSLWTGEWTLQLQPSKFSQYARSAEFLPSIVGWFWEQSKYQNQWFLFPLAAAWMWIILRGRNFACSVESLFFFALVLTPMMHAWYFTWIIPFAVVTRNRGAIFVTASAFVYFLLYHHVERPNGVWQLQAWETTLLWLPYVFGFSWSVLLSKRKTNL